MSNVAHALAPAPSESNFEGLTKRLLALRAEIDAILAELASHAMAMQRPEAIIAAPSVREMVPGAADPLTDSESMRDDAALREDGEPASGELADAQQIGNAATAEQPIADATAPEPAAAEEQTLDRAEPACDDAMPGEMVDAVPAAAAKAAGDGSELDVSPAADMAAATAIASAEQPGDAARLDATEPAPAEAPIQGEEARPEPVPTVDTSVAAAPVVAAGEALSEGAVINLDARQRRQKGEFAPVRTPKPARSSRHLVAKIAACIFVLLTAATILVMADHSAMGSVQSFPWMTPAPANPAVTDRTSQRAPDRAAATSDEAVADGLSPLADGILLLLRSRETWPSGS